jgi:hypothetical protein
LDYWDSVFCKCHDSWDEFYEYFKLQAGSRTMLINSLSCRSAQRRCCSNVRLAITI